jgi:hypothetical protein
MNKSFCHQTHLSYILLALISFLLFAVFNPLQIQLLIHIFFGKEGTNGIYPAYVAGRARNLFLMYTLVCSFLKPNLVDLVKY